MKLILFLSITILILNFTPSYSQGDSSRAAKKRYPVSILTTEPAVGLTAAQITGAVVSNVLQWNIKNKLSVVSYTGYTRNCAFLRDFNYVKTDYNYSLTQKFGIGTSFFTRHFSHTFSFLAGVKYDGFKETLDNPEFEKVSVSFHSLSPDFGILYNMKVGQKKYFFSFRMYIPLYPYPFKTDDVSATDGNLANVSLEFGVGIRLK